MEDDEQIDQLTLSVDRSTTEFGATHPQVDGVDRNTNTGPACTRALVPRVLGGFQFETPYTILCSTQGLHSMCEAVYNSNHIITEQLAAHVTLQQFEYVVVLAMYARQASINPYTVSAVYNNPHIRDLLSVATRDILLPEVICIYIESVGNIVLPNEVRLAPWFGTREEVQNPNLHNINVDDLLLAANRPIPDNYWSIDCKWIASWNMATMRVTGHAGAQFRIVNWGEQNGSMEMLVTPIPFHERGPDYSIPTAPLRLTVSEFNLGAVYRFRSFVDSPHWPGHTAVVCTMLFRETEIELGREWAECLLRRLPATNTRY